MTSQTDCLDYVADNESTGMREIYRDGVVVAHVAKKCVESARLLKQYNAAGEWGAYPPAPVATAPTKVVASEEEEAATDPLLQDAVLFVRSTGRASISSLQRHIRLGYVRAARLIEQMERMGVVTPCDRLGARQVVRS
jgi:DNA segregation ATPase FtsK/SpoIIIE-like protein